jgi:hypothetical protein
MIIIIVPSVQPMEVRLHTPMNVQENSNGYLLIEVTNETGSPLTGKANNVSCYIQCPDGTMLVNGAHPTEDIQPGAYYLEFRGAIAGCYPCWIYSNDSMDAGLFQVNSDVTDNATRSLSEWIGAEYDAGRNDRYATQQQMSFLITIQKAKAQNVTFKTEKRSFLGLLQDVAIGQSFQVLFWTILMSVMGIVSMLIATRHRVRKVVII